jgi:glycosyltransferase involved in cell wall biosynthesis
MSALHLSIITPSLNAERYIAQAVESVAVAGWGDFEHIVVDGGSTDGTLETLRRYPHLRVLVRPGLGLYPALNLGVAEATGDVIGLLNADDRYLPGALDQALAALAAADIDCAAGGARVVRLDQDARPELVRAYDDAPHKLLAWDPLLFGAPLINARLYRKAFMTRIGGFDARHTIAADRDWLIRAKLAGMRIAAVDAVLYEYREHAGSLTLNRARSNAAKIRDQHLAIIAAYIDDSRAASVMRRWHAWETGRKAVHCLAQGDIAAAVGAARRGVGENPLWPLRFLAEAPVRIAARLAS